jgi:cytochrome b561
MKTPSSSPARYSALARWFHWLTVLLVAILVPTGIAMVIRSEQKILDSVTDTLFSTHKLTGFTLLWLVALRLSYRFLFGAPPPDPGLTSWQRSVSRLNHWGMYTLLIILPLLGWLGISMFPAVKLFGLFDLPSIASPNKAAAEVVLDVHMALAWVLIALVSLHIAAVVYHAFIRRDGVPRRMLPASWMQAEGDKVTEPS